MHSTSICTAGDQQDLDAAILSESVHTQSLPRAGKRSGLFTKVPELDTWIDCVVMCCAETETCDVVFFFNQTCYMIKCNVSVPNGCEPVQKAHLNSTMVMVRQPGRSEVRNLYFVLYLIKSIE